MTAGGVVILSAAKNLPRQASNEPDSGRAGLLMNHL